MNNSTGLLLGLGLLATTISLLIFEYVGGEAATEGDLVPVIHADQREGTQQTSGTSNAPNRSPVLTEPLPASVPSVSLPAIDESIGPDRDSGVSSNYVALPWDGYDSAYMEEVLVPEHVWEDKYANSEIADLGAARGRIQVEWSSLAAVSWEERRLAGKVIRLEKKYSTDGAGVQKPIPFKLKKSGNIPYHQVMAHPPRDGQPAYYEFDWMPPDEYPEFYMLASELMWLNKKVGP